MPFDIWGDGTPEGPQEPFQPLDLGLEPDDLSRSMRDAIFAQLAPSVESVNAAEDEQDSGGALGTIGTILSIPEKALFGQAIKGAVRGGIEGGVGGAVEGFLRGTPFAFLAEALGAGDVARETSFADIREATGATDAREGWANFFLNLAGDIALSPLELLATPFGLTAKGSKAVLDKTAKASLAKAIASGERAALVFKVPFAKNAFAATNLGFKSGPMLVGQALDAIGGFVRTNAVTGPVVRLFSHAAATKDPEVAARAARAVASLDETRRTFGAQTLMAYQDGVSPAGKALVESGAYGGLITTLTEFGIDKIDDLGSFDDAVLKLRNADVTLRTARREALLAQPGSTRFKKLWFKATFGDQEAIRAIYHQFDRIPLTPGMLESAGLAAREGVERSWVTANESLAAKLDDAVRGVRPESGSGVYKRFAESEASRPGSAATAAVGAREKLVGEYQKLVGEIEAGTVDKAGLDSFLSFHRQQMIRFGRADIAAGFLNESVEPFLGLYAPHIMSPEAMNLIEDHFAATLSKYGYTHSRKLRDMLAVEINAVAEDFGTRATGFASLKKLRETRPESVLGAIFDRTFLKQLRKVDPGAAEFFQILPVHNVFTRSAATAERLAKRSFGKTFFADDSPAVLEVLTPEDFTRRAEEFLTPGSDHVAVLETRAAVAGKTRAEALELASGPEVAAQYEVASWQIREDTLRQMGDVRRRSGDALTELRQVRDLTSSSKSEMLKTRKDELLASHNYKRALNAVADQEREVAAAKSLLRLHKKRGISGRGKVTGDADMVYAYDQLRAKSVGKRTFDELTADLKSKIDDAESVLRGRRVMADAQRAAIDDFLDDVSEQIDLTIGGFKQEIKDVAARRNEAVESLLADKTRRLDLVEKIRKAGLSERELAREMVLQRQYAAHGVMALDEAARIPIEDGKRTLLDRLRERATADTRVKIVSRESFDAYRRIADDFARPDFLQENGLVRFLDQLKTAWAGHTIYNPLFLQTRVRNFLQNQVAAASGGLGTFGGHFEAQEAMSALRKSMKGDAGAMDALRGRFVKGTQISLYDALQTARQRGVIGAGGYAFEAGLTVEQAAMRTGRGTLKDAVTDLPSLLIPDVRGALRGKVRGVQDSFWLRKGHAIESTLDDHSRLAAYMAGLRKGLEPEAAAREVRRWLYDASNPMTWTERTLFRRLMPFYSFQKYAVGQMADLLLTKPGTVTTFEKMRRNKFEADGLDAKTLDTVLPRYIADGYGIPYRNTERGPEFAMFGTFLPVGEVAKIASAFDSQFTDPNGGGSANPFLRYFFGNMHPALRGAAEAVFQRDFYADRPIEDFPGQTQEMFGIAMPKQMVRWAQQLRFVNEINRLNILNVAEMKVMLNAVDRGAEKAEVGALDRLASSAFSPVPLPRVNVIDVGHEADYRRAKLEEAIRSTKGRMIRRAIGPAKATSAADLSALQTQYANQAAGLRRLERAQDKYEGTRTEPVRRPSSALEALLRAPR